MAITFNTTVSDVTMSSAKLSCTVSGVSSTSIVASGFQVHEGAGFGGEAMKDFFAENGERIACKLENGATSLSYNDLKSGTVLSARPYIYTDDYYYGDPVMVKIKTKEDYAPSIASLEVSSIGVNSATLSATVLAADSVYPITEAGFRYRPKEGYGSTVAVVCTPDANGKISAKIEDLTIGVKYVVWAYANCSIARMFTFKTFTTLGDEVLPTVSAPVASAITRTGMTLSATVTTVNASYKATEAGFFYRERNASTKHKIPCTPTDKGEITKTLSDLLPGKTYDVWSYVSYDENTFTEKASAATLGDEVLPTVSAPVASAITRTGMTLSATVTTVNASYKATEAGFFYRERSASTKHKIPCTPTDKGEITKTLSDLLPGKTYDVWSYVSYNENTFTEKTSAATLGDEVLPTVSAPVASAITRTGMTLSATVTTVNASYKATEAGFVYVTVGGANAKKVTCAPSSTGEITTKITGLEPDRNYIVRSYAVCDSVERTETTTISTLGDEALPGVSISDFDSVSATGFKITASVVTNHASYKPSEVGFVLKRKGLSGEITLDNGLTTREICTLSDGKFTLEKTAVGTGQYEVRAYLLSEGEDIYSDKSLDYSTTLSDCVPALRMENPEKGAVSVSDSKGKKISVSLSAVLGMTYGSDVTAKGFLYKQGTAPSSISDGYTKVDVVAGFASAVSLSIPDTGYVDYHFVAFATSKNGTGYSVPKRVRIWWKDGI